MGLVVFAGDAFIQCPLTSDYAAAKLFLRAVDPEQMPQGGTNIGAALQLVEAGAGQRGPRREGARGGAALRRRGPRRRGGRGASTRSRTRDVRVLAVGIGSEAGEPIPVYNRRGEFVGLQEGRERARR